MTLLPETYVDSMPCDDDLLVELGRVTWAAARLHAGVRDQSIAMTGLLRMGPSHTFGQAVKGLETRAGTAGRADQVDWVRTIGRPAVKMRNGVTHAVTYTAGDGRQAIGAVDHSPPCRYLRRELRQVTHTWSRHELEQVDAAGELHIAVKRPNDTMRRWTPIWVVCTDEQIYVRTWYRRDTGWFGDALRSHRARIRVPGLEADVTIEDVGDSTPRLRERIDTAYRTK